MPSGNNGDSQAGELPDGAIPINQDTLIGVLRQTVADQVIRLVGLEAALLDARSLNEILQAKIAEHVLDSVGDVKP